MASDTAVVGGSATSQMCPLMFSCANDTTVTCASSLDPSVVGEPDFQKLDCCLNPVVGAGWTDSFSGTCPRILVRTWTAMDGYGNTEQCVQTITIVDDGAAPTLNGVPNDTTVVYTSIPIPPLVTATDGCLNQQYAVGFNQQTIPGSSPNDFTLIRTWGTMDMCGNASDSVQTITVVSTLTCSVSAHALLQAPVSSGSASGFVGGSGVFQLTDPYGHGTIASTNVLNGVGNASPVDWMLIQLRDPVQPQIIVAEQAVVLCVNGELVNAEGDAIINFPSVPVGQYYVVVDHYNHLGTMTESPIDLTSLKTVDFTAVTTPLFDKGDAPTAIQNGARVLWMGDTSGDNIIKYIGADNDRDPILVRIGGNVPTNTVQGNYPEDVGLNGTVKYVGADNDRDPILINIGGSVPTNIRKAQLPEIQ